MEPESADPSTAAAEPSRAPQASAFSPARACVVFVVIALLLLALLGRVVHLQTEVRDRIAARLERQQHFNQTLPARRGSIFDSTGQLLAGSVQSSVLFVDPKFLIDQYDLRREGAVAIERDLARLSTILDLEPFALLQRISEKYPARYLELASDLDEQTIQAVRSIRMPGVGVQPRSMRIYPMGSRAAHVLGGVGRNGHGIEGVELALDELLSGSDGAVRMAKDARRRAIDAQLDDYSPPAHGRHVVLTIDARIQALVERELRNTVDRFRASGGEVVVLDPQTGAILALANYPSFSPQVIEDSSAVARTNRALVVPYEPGSTLKPFIVARAIAEKTTRLDQMWDIEGPTWRTSYGRRITDVHGYDKLNTWDVLVKSSNIGMSKIAESLGQRRLDDALRGFGIGRRSGIDLPGESAGQLRDVSKWTRHSTESLAQGYELLVTPMQMARAMASLANGGRLVTPHVIQGTLDADGQIASIRPPEAPLSPQSIPPQAASDVLRILADIPVRGTARNARLERYNLFGKTGTAHRAVNGQYNQENYTASFVGGAPYEDPRLVIAFIIHDPDKSQSHFGGIVAAPPAARILEESLITLGVAPSPKLDLPPDAIAKHLYQFNERDYTPREGDALRNTPASPTDLADVRD